jgi:hypothetical protein
MSSWGATIYLIPVWNRVKVVDKPAFLKDDFVLRFRFCYYNTSMFALNFLWIVYMNRCCIFMDHGLQSDKVYNLGAFVG